MAHVLAHQPRIAVLGDVSVTARDTMHDVALTSLPASLVAALVLAPGHSLSTQGLAQEIWGDEPPGNVKAALQTAVSRLRGRCFEGMIRSTAGGYALDYPDGAIDLDRARELRVQGSAALHAGDVLTAESCIRDGLALWTGEAGTGIGNPNLRAELQERADTARFDLLRLQAETCVAAGKYDEAVGLFADLRVGSPFSDPLCLLHLTALAQAGQVNEAIDEFARFRSMLADTLGTDPSEELARFHDSLLRQDETSATPTRIRVGLRAAPNDLIGRDDEVSDLTARLLTQRLITIVGMGGVGKTRLAQEVATQATASFPSVYFVELASAETATGMALTIALALGLAGHSGAQADDGSLPRLTQQIVSAINDRPTLLVLDNLEQVIEEAADFVADILGATSALRVLVTSRAALEIGSERLFYLTPLTTTSSDGQPSTAVELFLDRALAIRPAAQLPLDIVTRLCEHLDGLPLAIELAAARLRSMTVIEIEAGLTNRFALLTAGDRSAPMRHRTLHAVIDWSWELLTESQQVLCRRVAFFAESFTATSARYVLGTDGASADMTMLDDLDAVVAQSILRVDDDPGAGSARYRMLETVREFCRQQAIAAGEELMIRHAQCHWARETTQIDFAEFWGPAHPLASRRIGAERENLLSVLRAAAGLGDADTVACVAATVGVWQLFRGGFAEISAIAPFVQDTCAGESPEGPWASMHLWTQLLIGTLLILGSPRRGARARTSIRRAAAATRGTEQVGAPTGVAAAELFLALGRPEDLARIVTDAKGSDNPVIRRLAYLFSAVQAENDGAVNDAFSFANEAHRQAVAAEDLWTQASAANLLAKLHRQNRQPEDALWWLDAAEAQLTTLGIEQRGRVMYSALDQLASGRLDAAQQGFESVLEAKELTIDQRLMSRAGLAEIALAQGRVSEGLSAFRALTSELTWAAMDQIMPNMLLSSACVIAHVRAGHGADPMLRDLAESLRALSIQTYAVMPDHADRPVTASAALACLAWLTTTQNPDIGTMTDNAIEMFALTERLHSRQDYPSLAREPVWDVAAAWLGGAAVQRDWTAVRSDAQVAAERLSLRAATDRIAELLAGLG